MYIRNNKNHLMYSKFLKNNTKTFKIILHYLQVPKKKVMRKAKAAQLIYLML